MDHLSFNDYVTILGIAAGTIVTVASLAWAASQYFARQFNSTRQLIDNKIEKLELNVLNKLEYHEKHDDQRFSALYNDVWDIRVRNAARDGLTPLLRDKESSQH
jgi:hypothetical protein